MKSYFFCLITLLGISQLSLGQSPFAFQYQAVVRGDLGYVLPNQPVGMQISIHQTTANGPVVYQETHNPTSDPYGLVHLEIGNGTAVSGDFSTIDWSQGPYFIEVELDIDGGTNYTILGTSQLLSVPYSLFALEADMVLNEADSDPANELQDWSTLPGIPAGIADGIDNVDDADNDPTNELQDWSTLPGIPASIADGIDNVDDADNDPNNELQDWSTLPGIPAGIADGIDNVDDADNDPTNELQDWSTLPGIPAGFADGIDNVDDADNDPTNELQDWSNLPGIPAGFADDTDDVDDADNDPTNELQDWSNLPGIPAGFADDTDDVDDADNDPTNELQSWTNLPGIPSDFTDDTDDVDDADNDPTNELQDISINEDTIFLDNGGFGILPEPDTNALYVTQDLTAPIPVSYQGDTLFVHPTDNATDIDWTTAESTCTGLTAFGHSDWVLPTQSMLYAIYKQSYLMTGLEENADWKYWSSTAEGASNAYTVRLDYGAQDPDPKINASGVRCRCVRMD